MPDNVQDATFEFLKRIQESIADLGRRFEQHRAEINQRLDAFAAQARKDRRNLNGMMALVQAASGDFDERIRELDERVSTLEDRAG